MLIRNAGMLDGTITDVRVDDASVTAIGQGLSERPGDAILDARGGALLRGLHDHHVHLMALAASLESMRCGPPQVSTAQELERQLRERAMVPADDDSGWIRGIGYHESVAGDIDRAWLDRVVPARPVRIQHRSGRLWIVNSCGLERLASAAKAAAPSHGEDPEGMAAGRLLDADRWLRERLGGRPPSLARVSALLASYGVTGVTDASASNALADHRRFLDAASRGDFAQQLVVMGDASLDDAGETEAVRRGPTKIYLRESDLPPIAALVAAIERSHAAGRPVAVHCVTETEVVYAAAALAGLAAHPGDRIEHASVAPPDVVSLLAGLRLTVVTQPNFVRERGDAYLDDVPVCDQPWLYRGRGFVDAGIRLAAGTDAPLGDPNPWLAMQAAVDRRTALGRTLGDAESLSPEEALALFGGEPLAPGGGLAPIDVGSAADLCLLDRPWSDARRSLAAVRVNATVRLGRLVWRRET
jgi:predicted amidohydrolase YtcJ